MKRAILGMLLFTLTVSVCETQVWADMPGRLKVNNHELVLNGSGSRVKSFIGLYEGGLYLPRATNNAGYIVEANAPMAIKIKITSIFVDQKSLVAAISDGFEKSTDGNTEPIREEIQAFRNCFSEEIKRGDVFDIVYIPNAGIAVVKNNRQKGLISGLAFKQAVFGIWLGDAPADAGLKKGLLGE